MRKSHAWIVATGGALLLVGGAVAPPFVEGTARLVLRQAFAPVCHQMPGRSFALGGVPFAVCHRCFGLYVGLLTGTLLWPLLALRLKRWTGRHAGPLVLLAALPVGLDWTLDAVGWWTNTALSQTTTGALLGMMLGLLLARAAEQALGRDGTPLLGTSS